MNYSTFIFKRKKQFYLYFISVFIKAVFLNGALAYDLFLENYADCGILYKKLPSTSPANPRYDETVWVKALDGVFAPPESI